ncbi:hypothetical protein ES703_120540 [subsurface metagenome]
MMDEPGQDVQNDEEWIEFLRTSSCRIGLEDGPVDLTLGWQGERRDGFSQNSPFYLFHCRPGFFSGKRGEDLEEQRRPFVFRLSPNLIEQFIDDSFPCCFRVLFPLSV